MARVGHMRPIVRRRATSCSYGLGASTGHRVERKAWDVLGARGVGPLRFLGGGSGATGAAAAGEGCFFKGGPVSCSFSD